MGIAIELHGDSDGLDFHFKKNIIQSMAIVTERRGYSDEIAWL